MVPMLAEKQEAVAQMLREIKKERGAINYSSLTRTEMERIAEAFPPPKSWERAAVFSGFNPLKERKFNPLPSFEECVAFLKDEKEKSKSGQLNPESIKGINKRHYFGLRKYGIEKVYRAAGLDPLVEKLKPVLSRDDHVSRIISRLWQIKANDGRIDISHLKKNYRNVVGLIYYHMKDDGKWSGAVSLMGLDPETERKGVRMMRGQLLHILRKSFDLHAMTDEEIEGLIDMYKKYPSKCEQASDFLYARRTGQIARYQECNLDKYRPFFRDMFACLKETRLNGPFSRALSDEEKEVFVLFLQGHTLDQIVSRGGRSSGDELQDKLKVCNILDLCQGILRHFYNGYFEWAEGSLLFCPKPFRNNWATLEIQKRVEERKITIPEVSDGFFEPIWREIEEKRTARVHEEDQEAKDMAKFMVSGDGEEETLKPVTVGQEIIPDPSDDGEVPSVVSVARPKGDTLSPSEARILRICLQLANNRGEVKQVDVAKIDGRKAHPVLGLLKRKGYLKDVSVEGKAKTLFILKRDYVEKDRKPTPPSPHKSRFKSPAELKEIESQLQMELDALGREEYQITSRLADLEQEEAELTQKLQEILEEKEELSRELQPKKDQKEKLLQRLQLITAAADNVEDLEMLLKR